jgi:cellulose biosynthesis protein BcsQ
MEKETLYVAFSTQKGGMGKTTLTVLTASYLHYAKGYNVAIVDCDHPQHSIEDLRKRDMETVQKDSHYKQLALAQFKELNKPAYKIQSCTPLEAIKVAEELQNTNDLDIIFFDLPGTLNTDGVIKTISSMDFIFAPMSADRFVLESTMQFACLINEKLIQTGKSNIRGLYMIWNMVDSRERTDLYETYDKAIAEIGLNVLKTGLPDSKKFRKELGESRKIIFRSTLFPADKSLIKVSKMGDLLDEICQIININDDGSEEENN